MNTLINYVNLFLHVLATKKMFLLFSLHILKNTFLVGVTRNLQHAGTEIVWAPLEPPNAKTVPT